MSLPGGVFIIVITCADCGKELNRSKPITAEQYTTAVLLQPLTTGPCPNGCRSTWSDCNINVNDYWEREDGTRIEKETVQG